MGRPNEGWKLRGDPGEILTVRFTHAHVRHEYSTGERDPERAAAWAAHRYAEVVSGRFRKVQGGVVTATTDLAPVMAEWLASIESTLDPETWSTYAKTYVRTHFIPFFGTLGALTPARIADYSRERLTRVVRKTVQKELSALRGFLAWCKERDILLDVPPIPPLPRKATGVRSGPQRAQAVEVTPAEAEWIIMLLPEWSRRSRRNGRRHPIQSRFAFAWETTLRPATLDALRVPEHYRKGAATLTIPDGDDKSRYGREIPLTEAARTILDAVCPEKGPIFGTHDYRETLKKAALSVLGEHRARQFAAYDFRHGRVNDMLDQSADMRGVAFLAGHRRLTTTDAYAKPAARAGARVVALLDGGSGEVVGRRSIGVVRRAGLEPAQVFSPLEPERSAEDVISRPCVAVEPPIAAEKPGADPGFGDAPKTLRAAAEGMAALRLTDPDAFALSLLATPPPPEGGWSVMALPLAEGAS